MKEYHVMCSTGSSFYVFANNFEEAKKEIIDELRLWNIEGAKVYEDDVYKAFIK